MVRRHAVLLTLLAPALAACSDDPGIVSDAGDLDAAITVWADPWVAPTSATVAGPSLGSDGMTDRVVGRRETTYATGVRAAARSELRVARATGWSPTSSACSGTVEVALVGPHQLSLAHLVVAPDGEGATATLQVATRHHLDGSAWQVPDAADGTCLDGEASELVPPPLQGEPLGRVTDTREAEWQLDGAAEDFVAAVNTDPAMQELGVTVAVPRLADGVNRRQAPGAEVALPVRSLQQLAERLPGWRLTYAACGGGGPVRATFVTDVSDGHVVLSAEVRPDGAQVRVTLPMTEGPAGEWLDDIEVIDQAACLRADATRRLDAYGTPAVLPTSLTPIAD